MRVSEWVALAYFSYLGILSWTRRVPRASAARTATAVAVAGVVAASLATRPLPELRNWLPAVYVLVGYWMSGFFYVGPMPATEAAFAAMDRSLFEGLNINGVLERAPRPVLECLELAYLWCYPLLPAGFAALVLAGRSDLANWYWTIVLAAELSSYGALPWVQTRSPRVIEVDVVMDRRNPIVRRLNRAILERGSIHVNTFPSGHTAGALAVALAVITVTPPAGVLFVMIALSIAVASVVGRYHYAVDALAGLLVAIVTWAVVQVLWPA